jgi:hypothetical protein
MSIRLVVLTSVAKYQSGRQKPYEVSFMFENHPYLNK